MNLAATNGEAFSLPSHNSVPRMYHSSGLNSVMMLMAKVSTFLGRISFHRQMMAIVNFRSS